MVTYNVSLENKVVLVTGAAGFIGANLVKRLLNEFDSVKVIGIDSITEYYDVRLKYERLQELSAYGDRFVFIKDSIAKKEIVESIFTNYHPQIVVNLAAQAGVRYSITNPDAYIESNLIGFYNILEACRHYGVEHLVYASSSSVYGNNKKVPYSTDDKVDNPVSLYAATKKSNELMAHAYSKLYNILNQPVSVSLLSMVLAVVLIWHILALPTNFVRVRPSRYSITVTANATSPTLMIS